MAAGSSMATGVCGWHSSPPHSMVEQNVEKEQEMGPGHKTSRSTHPPSDPLPSAKVHLKVPQPSKTEQTLGTKCSNTSAYVKPQRE